MDLPTDHNAAVAHQDIKGLHLLWLLMVLAIALAVRVEFFVGCLGTDDLVAWNRAAQFSQSHWCALDQNFNIVATLRYGLSLPVAGIFTLFGISETTANVFPLLMSLLAVAAVWDLTRRLTGSLAMACIAALWLAMIGLDISYSSVLLPDGPLSSLGVLCVWGTVLAIRCGDGKPLASSLLFFISGFLAGYAISVKLPGIGLIVTLFVWSASSLTLKQWRLKMLWILCGFFLAVALEHLFFWAIHGDLFYRWLAIPNELESYRQQMLSGALVPEEQDLDYYFSHVRTWLSTFAKVAPSAALTIATTLIATIYLLIARWRDAAIRLLVCLVIVLLTLKIPEFMKTYSFQPRRMLPLAVLGPIITLAAVHGTTRQHVRSRASSILSVVVSLALVVSVTLLLFSMERPYLRKLEDKVAVERAMCAWIQNHEVKVENDGFFTDHRSLRTVNALCGFQLAKRNIHTYPAYWLLADGNILEPEPPLYNPLFDDVSGPVADSNMLDRGYWGVNPPVIRWLQSKKAMPSLVGCVEDVPDYWTLEKVLGIFGDVKGNNGAIYKIRPPGAEEMMVDPSWLSFVTPMQGKMIWRVKPPETAVNLMGSIKGIQVAATEGGRSQLISPKVAWNKHAAGFEGDFLLSVAVSSPDSHVKFDGRVCLQLEAYDEKKRRMIVHRSWKKDTELPATFHAYVRKPPSAENLRVKFYFFGRGIYRIERILVRPAASNSLRS